MVVVSLAAGPVVVVVVNCAAGASAELVVAVAVGESPLWCDALSTFAASTVVCID